MRPPALVINPALTGWDAAPADAGGPRTVIDGRLVASYPEGSGWEDATGTVEAPIPAAPHRARVVYRVRFEEDWSFGQAATTFKLPGLGGGNLPRGGDPRPGGFTVRVQAESIDGVSARPDLYVYAPGLESNTGGFGTILRGSDVRLRSGADHEIAVTYHALPGDQGFVALELDGVEVVAHDGFAGSDGIYGNDRLIGDSFFGGVGVSPKDQVAYFGPFVVRVA